MDTRKDFDKHLRRYTNLASVIDTLLHRRLTLLDPQRWEDKNDSVFLAAYKKRMKAKTVLAICFTKSSETYHHWRSYSYGSDGACIEFRDEQLLDHITNNCEGVVHREVIYKELAKLEAELPTDAELPFVKRYPYIGENEYRLIYVAKKKTEKVKHIPIDYAMIRRITLSPWMPQPLVKSVKKGLALITPGIEIETYQSKLINYPRWQSALKRGQTPEPITNRASTKD